MTVAHSYQMNDNTIIIINKNFIYSFINKRVTHLLFKNVILVEAQCGISTFQELSSEAGTAEHTLLKLTANLVKFLVLIQQWQLLKADTLEDDEAYVGKEEGKEGSRKALPKK